MSPGWYRTLSTDARRAFWTSFTGFSLDAMDIQLYAFVLPILMTAWGMGPDEAGWLATVALVSSAAGGWMAGLLADRFGRVRILKITILWFAVCTCLCGLASSFEELLIARALQGLGFGGELAVGAVFIGEMATPLARGRMVGTVQSGWAVGWALAAAISTIVLAVLPPDLGWRITFAVGLVPALIIFSFRRRLKEPQIFQRARRRVSWRAIFARPMLAATLKGSLLPAGMHGGYWAIATWWPAMLRAERGLSIAASSPYLATLISGSFVGYMVGAWLSDRVGRKRTLAGFALTGIALALTYAEVSLSNASLLLLSAPLGFVATGMFAIIGSVLTELYPTELRGSGLGFCYNFGRGAAGAAPVLIGTSADRLGIGPAIGLYVACAYCLVLVAVALLPETRGRELRNLTETSS